MDDEIKAAINKAAIAMLGQEIKSERDEADPLRTRTQAAAVEICRRAGILDVLTAVTANGSLRPPPIWPEADIVPVGGGVNFLTCEVRTFVKNKGLRSVSVRMSTTMGKISQDQIAEAFQRGRWALRKQIGGRKGSW